MQSQAENTASGVYSSPAPGMIIAGQPLQGRNQIGPAAPATELERVVITLREILTIMSGHNRRRDDLIGRLIGHEPQAPQTKDALVTYGAIIAALNNLCGAMGAELQHAQHQIDRLSTL